VGARLRLTAVRAAPPNRYVTDGGRLIGRRKSRYNGSKARTPCPPPHGFVCELAPVLLRQHRLNRVTAL
jgi:hypothetical protein